MATTDQIQAAVNNGRLYVIQLLKKQLVLFKNGTGSVSEILPITRLIRGLQFQLNAAINDERTSVLYNCLIRSLGGFAGNYQIDPDVSISGQTTVVVSVIAGYNSDMIRLTSTEESPAIQIADYQGGFVPGFGGTWVSRYGNNPELALYSNQGVLLVGDEQTPPNRTYAVANDPTSNLLSILYDFGLPQDVYLQISGQGQSSTTVSSGGVIPPALTFNESNLVQDADDSWYLPLIISPLRDVAVVTSNNVTVSGWTYNRSDYAPGRIYGFANNDTQTIKVKII